MMPASPTHFPESANETSEELTGDTDSLKTDERNVEDTNVYEERFRVDRRKLESMLQGDNGTSTGAEDFFLEIMESTNTHITWPSKLKIGAKSKKDPHIKVSGDPVNVKEAKEKIMAILDTKSNRVTLKMDVSYMEHSHVIGKGGNNIRRVMEDTGCHIHFPDSNRNNQADKSNQVSIAGQPYGVECARMKIRELLPIALMFESPVTAALLQLQPDQASPVIQRLQQQYNVMVTFKQRPRVFTTTVIVRGTVNNAKGLKEATILLMEHLTGNLGAGLPVTLQLDVATQHHLFMIGRGGSNLQHIMAKTGAVVCFPELSTLSSVRKGTILISGSIDSVLSAREHIIGCLPLVLMFDMKEEISCDQSFINTLMEKLDVFISIKPKPKQPSKSVIVKSIEQNAANVYEARRLLLGLEREEMPSSTLSTANILPASSKNIGLLTQNLLNVNTNKSLLVVNGHISPITSPTQGQGHSPPAWSLNSGVSPIMVGQTSVVPTKPSSNDIQSYIAQTDIYSSALKATSQDHNQNCSKPSLLTPAEIAELQQQFNGNPALKNAGIPSSTPLASSLNGKQASPGNPSSGQQTVSRAKDMESIAAKSLRADGSLNLHGSGAGLLTSLNKGMKLHLSGSGADLRAFQQQQQQQHSSPLISRRSYSLSNGLSNSHGSSESSSASEGGDKKAAGNERPIKPPPGIHQPPNGAVNPTNVSAALADYERKKVMASKAIEQEPFGETRNPTDFWSGLGFSRSMPDSVIRDRLRQNNIRYDGSNMSITYEQHEMEEDGDPWKDSRRVNALPDELVTKFDQFGLSASLSGTAHIDAVTAAPISTPSWSASSPTKTAEKSDIAELFLKLGLERYIDLFQQQEIDLATFTTLNDQDLKELGISTFGARRKMLIAIADLQKSRQKYFSPTPGSNNPFRQMSATGGPFPNRQTDIVSQSGRW